MKKHLKNLIFPALILAFFVPFLAQSVEFPNPLGPDSTIWTLVGGLINWAFYISLVVGVIMISISAFTFLTSAGDPEKVRKGRNLIIWAIVGIVVIFLSKAIINLLMYALGVEATIP